MEIIAVVWVLGLVAYVFVPVLAESRAAATREACAANLNTIGKALSSYMTENDSRWPFARKLRSLDVKPVGDRWPTLPVAIQKQLPESSPAWHCPIDARRLPADDPLVKACPDANSYYESEGLSYEWWWAEPRGGIRIGEESVSSAKGFGYARPDQKVLSDFEPFHAVPDGAAFNVLYADFRVRTLKAYSK